MAIRKLKVFLCHAAQDKAIVRQLYQKFLLEGWIDPWLDEAKLLPGQNWDREIKKAVESTDVVIVCISTTSVTKEGYIQKELRYVLDIAQEKPDEEIFIVPVRLDNCRLPHQLEVWQYIDFFPIEQNEWAMGRIIASLQLRASKLNIDNSYTSESTKVPMLWIGDHKITIDGKMINVTKSEFEFLKFLSNQKGYCSTEEIGKGLYGSSEGFYDATIRTLVKRLRDKLGDDSHRQRYIETSGIGGYKLTNWAKSSEE